MQAIVGRDNSTLPLPLPFPIPIITFDTFQSTSLLIFIIALLIASPSPSVTRVRTWYTLLGSFAFYCFSFLLLVGRQTGEEPPLGLCAWQAGMIHAAPPLIGAASLIFVIELYMRLTAVTLSRAVNENVILWMPWSLPIAHAIAFWVALGVGLSDVKLIERHPSGIYCRINHTVPPTLAGSMVVFFAGLLVILEVYTAVHLYRHRMLIKRLDSRGNEFPLQAFVRMGIVTILGGFAIIMVFVINEGPTGGGSLNILAALPFAVALVFGFQKDLLRASMFWKRKKPKLYNELHPTKSPV